MAGLAKMGVTRCPEPSQALRRAYRGNLQMQSSPGQDLVRVDWSR